MRCNGWVKIGSIDRRFKKEIAFTVHKLIGLEVLGEIRWVKGNKEYDGDG